MRKKKKFGQTTFGKILKGAVGIINPTLGAVLEGATTVEDAIAGIGAADAPIEDKLRAKEMVLEAYEAEVADRVSARQREAAVAMSGGNDIMFKGVGFGVMAVWAFLLYALFFGDLTFNDSVEDLMNIAFGAVSSQMMAVVSYYFGSSAPKQG